MYQTLYRKYRPRTFSDVCGQTRITTVLRRQVEEGTLTHAYLFCGTRGTGKTTCAKILAKVANCLNPQAGEPCNECENCLAADRGELLDILEVDAASNTGVENIRRLCEELNFMPAQGKKRVYIIDEVHMLSIGAFNALLKTLEEPPAHALFILATTELHKVPATVRSRCQCFTFHRLSLDDIAERVLFVSKEEDIPLDASGARLVARLSDGAMRDALSLLELCVGHEGKLTEDELDRLFGLGDGECIKELTLSALRGDSAKSLKLLSELYQSMGDLKEVLSQVLGAVRDMLLYRVGAEFETTSNRTQTQQTELQNAAETIPSEKLLYAVGVLEEALVRFERLTVNKKTICEMALLRICSPQLSDSSDAILARLSSLEEKMEQGLPFREPNASVPRELPERAETSSMSEKEEDLPWVEDPSPSEPIPPRATARAAAPRAEKPTAGNARCSYADALLKKLGSSDPLFASFCAGLTLVEEDGVLTLYGETFTLTMLRSREKSILEEARGFSPALTSVRFVEGKPKPSANNAPADLGEF